MAERILIVDDDAAVRTLLAAFLTRRGYRTKTVGDAESALRELKTPYDCVISDIRLPGMDGVALMGRIKNLSPHTEVILVTGFATVDSVIKAIEYGAFGYISKPIHEEELFQTVARAMEKQKLIAENQRLVTELKESNKRLENLARTLEKRVEERTKELAIINEVTSAITSSIDLNEVFKIVVREIRKIIRFDRASISLVSESGTINKVYFLTSPRGEAPESGRAFPLKGTGIEWVITNKKTLIRGDLNHANRFIEDDYIRESGAQSGIVVPLIYRGKAIGTFNLGSTKKNTYTEAHAKILRHIAGEIAIALKNAELHQELMEHSTNLEAKVAERTRALQENLSHLKRAQEKLIQSEKLAATSKLIAGVAHEIKNPLNSMSFSTANIKNILSRRADFEETRESCKESLAILKSDIERLKSLVDRFMAFAKPSQIKLEMGDINDIIGRAVQSLRGELSQKDITIAERYDRAIPLLKIEKDEFHRSILNLLLNSIEALNQGGRIEVSTMRSDGLVFLEVKDNGCGIPPEIQDKIFDIFFTTKPQGSGLGLSQVYRTIESHHGSISFHSEPRRGTHFHVTLPLK